MNAHLLGVIEASQQGKFNQAPVERLQGFLLWILKKVGSLRFRDEYRWSHEKLSSVKVHVI